jgi:hypothetical protein
MTVAGMTHPESRITDWIKHGLIGGIVAGVAFAMFEMVMAAIQMGGEAVFMPLRMIGAMLLGQQALDPGFSLLAAGAAGLGVHLVLSMIYGVAVAAAAHYIPALGATRIALLLWASAAGLGLWVVNFYIVAPIVGWTWFPQETDPIVQAVAHTVFFGTVLGVYLNSVARRG